MAYQIPYHQKTIKPINDVVPGNDLANDPVEFDIAPAEGADQARIKSMIFATVGLSQGADWGPAMQDAVIKAFETGAPAFRNTVLAIRGLTVPAGLALRMGIIPDLPTHVPAGKSAPEPNPNAPIPVINGQQFERICGFVPLMGLHVASEIAALTQKCEAMDPRFFVQPSGSGGPATTAATDTGVKPARRRPKGKGTAASRIQ